MALEGLEMMEEYKQDDDAIGFRRKCDFIEEKVPVEYPDGSVVCYNCVLNN